MAAASTTRTGRITCGSPASARWIVSFWLMASPASQPRNTATPPRYATGAACSFRFRSGASITSYARPPAA